jgi:hypothetical protein
MLKCLLILPVLLVALVAGAAEPAKKPTLAVLPFVPASAKDKELAADFRKRVAGKADTSGAFDRKDNVEVENAVSALGVLTTEAISDDDMQRILQALGADMTLAATVEGRTVSATLYKGKEKLKSTRVEIPGGKDSPKMALEQIWKDLMGDGVEFARVRDKEVDRDDAAAEKRWADAKNPNLVKNAGFEEVKTGDWGAILGADRYAPPLLSEADAKNLAADKVAVVPAGVGAKKGGGQILMMRMSRNVAENNGLACESIWIPVESGKKYRFSVMYHSTGPAPRLFLKGFAEKPDQFGDKKDPETTRREYYRFQVLPRKKNEAWEAIEADFTPVSLKPTDPKVQWLRVDLYIYLSPGDVFFDDVVVKKISE